MFDKISLSLSDEDKKLKDDAFQLLKEKYLSYSDPWGFDIGTIGKALDVIFPLYRNYFRVRAFGLENIKDEPYMLVSNHTGQLPIDGVLITTALAVEKKPPRVIHSMIERFMAQFPFLGDVTAQTGSILGDRENCKWLLDKKESILVFPEGVRGISKNTTDFYKLQTFSNGFYRIALESKVKILPIAVIGAEEMFPFVVHAKKIGKFLGLPSLPILSNLVPLPSPIDIYFGEPIELPSDISPEAKDEAIRVEVEKIEKIIKEKIEYGLEQRRPFADKIRKPISEMLTKFTKDDD